MLFRVVEVGNLLHHAEDGGAYVDEHYHRPSTEVKLVKELFIAGTLPNEQDPEQVDNGIDRYLDQEI